MTDEQIVALVNDAKTELKVDLLEHTEQVETTLLKEFRKWAVRNEASRRVADTSIAGFNEGTNVLEERVDDLEHPHETGLVGLGLGPWAPSKMPVRRQRKFGDCA